MKSSLLAGLTCAAARMFRIVSAMAPTTLQIVTSNPVIDYIGSSGRPYRSPTTRARALHDQRLSEEIRPRPIIVPEQRIRRPG